MLFDMSTIRQNGSQVLSNFSNVDYENVSNGMKLTGQFLITKDSDSFLIRWKSKMPIWKLLSFSKTEYDQVIKASEIYSIILDIEDLFTQLNVFRIGYSEPLIWRVTGKQLLFAQELIQDFSLYSTFLSNPNWGNLIKLVSNLPDTNNNSISLKILFPCYQSTFSYPSFLNKYSVLNEEITFYRSNFPEIISQFKLQSNLEFPITHSEFSIWHKKGKSIKDIGKIIEYRGLDKELRYLLWPVYLSILPPPIRSSSSEEEIEIYQNIYKFRLAEYLKLKFQWESLSRYQLVQWKIISSAFYTITIDVKRTSIPETLLINVDKSDITLINKISSLFKIVLINILKTYAIWNFRIRYTQGINELAVPFASIAVYDVVNYLIDMHQKAKKAQDSALSEIDKKFSEAIENEDKLSIIIQEINEMDDNSIEIDDMDLDDKTPLPIPKSQVVSIDNNQPQEKKRYSFDGQSVDNFINSQDFESSFPEIPETEIEYTTVEQIFDNDASLIQKVKESEAISFWCFASFLEQSQSVLLETSMNNLIEKDMPAILEIIQNQSPETFRFLKDNQHDNLQFYVSAVMLLFRRSFNESKVERLWDSIIAINDEHDKEMALIRKKNFEYAFAAAALIFAVPLLKKNCYMQSNQSNENDNEKFLLNINEIIKQIPVDLVIQAALSIEQKMPLIVKPQTQNIDEENLENEYFSPSMIKETTEYQKFNLFF